jgi:hypothetical protein
MPEYIVCGYASWADGDNSPAQMERMAEVFLGDGRSFQDGKKNLYKYYCVTTAIINNKVWLAYQFDHELFRYIPHSDDDEEEE